MRTVLAVIAVTSLALLLPGCPLACGYEGQGDRVFARGSDQMILCANGGYAATLPTGTIEGRYTTEYGTDGEVIRATDGASGAATFTLTAHADGTASAPELGALAWEQVYLGTIELDLAHMQCLDVETRAWWSPTL